MATPDDERGCHRRAWACRISLPPGCQEPVAVVDDPQARRGLGAMKLPRDSGRQYFTISVEEDHDLPLAERQFALATMNARTLTCVTHRHLRPVPASIMPHRRRNCCILLVATTYPMRVIA